MGKERAGERRMRGSSLKIQRGYSLLAIRFLGGNWLGFQSSEFWVQNNYRQFGSAWYSITNIMSRIP